jgi:hypothetical protein
MGCSASATTQSAAAAREADNNITTMGATYTNDEDNDEKMTKIVEVKLDVDEEIHMEALLKSCLVLQQQQPQDMEVSQYSPLLLTWRRQQKLTMRALVTENREALCEALYKDMGKSRVSTVQCMPHPFFILCT